jgi:hypothetical protein
LQFRKVFHHEVSIAASRSSTAAALGCDSSRTARNKTSGELDLSKRERRLSSATCSTLLCCAAAIPPGHVRGPLGCGSSLPPSLVFSQHQERLASGSLGDTAAQPVRARSDPSTIVITLVHCKGIIFHFSGDVALTIGDGWYDSTRAR